MLRLKQQRAQKEAEAARAAEEAAKAAAAASTTGNDGDIAAPISVFGIDGVAVVTKKSTKKRTPGEIRIQKGKEALSIVVPAGNSAHCGLNTALVVSFSQSG